MSDGDGPRSLEDGETEDTQSAHEDPRLRVRSLDSLAARKLMRTGNDVTVLARGAGKRFSMRMGLSSMLSTLATAMTLSPPS